MGEAELALELRPWSEDGAADSWLSVVSAEDPARSVTVPISTDLDASDSPLLCAVAEFCSRGMKVEAAVVVGPVESRFRGVRRGGIRYEEISQYIF